ncbi:MAG: 16S rRNA (guanine(966)-N(2))-methyltransferase RsmD [Thermoanaerobaculia bacterium]
MSRGVRLSAGRLKGRLLPVPAGARPTGSRVREALFDVLGPRVCGCAFADLFAGSGAVGLEAWSRGARRVVLVEGERKAAEALRRTVARLGAPGVRVLRAKLPSQLTRCHGLAEGGFDVVFADPPYRFGRHGRLLEGAATLLLAGGVVVLEHAEGESVPDSVSGLRRTSSRRYGESALTFYEAVPEASPAGDPSASRK